jgi:hypothetical protein
MISPRFFDRAERKLKHGLLQGNQNRLQMPQKEVLLALFTKLVLCPWVRKVRRLAAYSTSLYSVPKRLDKAYLCQGPI